MSSITQAAGSIGSGMGGIAGGIIGKDMSAGAAGDANNQAIMANNILQAIKDAPDISKPLILQQYKQAGYLTPEMEANITAQVPAAISTDPRYKTAQMQALSQMQQRANTGLTQGDRAALNQAELQAQGDTKSRLASIQQQMQERGQAGGGAELAAKLAAAQNESNQMASSADRQAEISQNAREQALGQLGQYGSQLQGQDFGQQFQQQQAQNEMNRFNTQNALGVQQRNVGASNQAQAANLANAQNVGNMNVNQNNQEQNNQLNRQMQQAAYNRQNAAMKAGGASNLGAYFGNQAANQAQAGANIGAGIGGIMGAGMAAAGSGKGGSGDSGAGDMAGGAEAAEDFMYKGGQAHDFKQGGPVPGHAPVNGDSPANDIVHAVLSPGEIVIPRTLSESKFGKHILKIIDAHNNLKKHVNGDQNG